MKVFLQRESCRCNIHSDKYLRHTYKIVGLPLQSKKIRGLCGRHVHPSFLPPVCDAGICTQTVRHDLAFFGSSAFNTFTESHMETPTVHVRSY